MRFQKHILTAASALALICGAGGAFAQDAPPVPADPTQADDTTVVDEIVVTGSRLRDESVQETPIAVSVVNAQMIADLHAPDVRALSSTVPNLQISQNPTASGTPLIFLRGFGVVGTEVATEPGVALYVDGVYQPTVSGALAELFDTDRVEVLRGPQSTLLGKNASAGALLLRRIRPNPGADPSTKIQAEYGTYNLVQTQALTTFPIIRDVLAAKLYGYYRKRDGYIENRFPGGADGGAEDTYTVRGAFVFEPTPDFNLYVTADYSARNPTQSVGRAATPATAFPCANWGYCATDLNLRRVMNTDYNDKPRARDHNITADAEWSLGGVKLSSISGYRRYSLLNDADLDVTPVPVFHVNDQIFRVKSFSEELRLSSEENGGFDLGGRLAWLVAGYYNHSTSDQTQPQYTRFSPAAAVSVSNQASQTIRTSYALFAHLDYDITDRLTASFGARKSWDETEHNFSLRGPGAATPALTNGQTRKDDNFSIEAGLNYQIDDTKMVYGRYSEGYRGGGFIGLVGSLAQSVGGYGPETSTSWEVGAKTEFFDRRLLLNVAVYDTKFEDLQRSQTESTGTGFVMVTRNIAGARTRGVELETVIKPMDGLQLRGSVGYLDAKYTNYVVNGVDLSSTPFSFAPEWTASFMPSYEFPIATPGDLFDTARVQANIAYGSERLVSSVNDPLFIQDGYTTVDLQLNLSGGQGAGYTVSAYLQNAFDKDYLTYASRIASISTFLFDNPGRLFGLSVEMKF
ncbi:iron complex outermembrane receptor protein [Brevundimonas vesicularis]|uniref:TonB-dependent receptor n=1 Tax=Brevundimonas vesicularis TaxID=41276 RepID=UPI00278B1085|nr:TonB-dependent receptor [Brevundimonas vesicularis]MDQ1191595.1 iron complex outermembrane receptor protein [Brevundimonas vesicularis]